jgi:hypothetical protein
MTLIVMEEAKICPSLESRKYVGSLV